MVGTSLNETHLFQSEIIPDICVILNPLLFQLMPMQMAHCETQYEHDDNCQDIFCITNN